MKLAPVVAQNHHLFPKFEIAALQRARNVLRSEDPAGVVLLDDQNPDAHLCMIEAVRTDRSSSHSAELSKTIY